MSVALRVDFPQPDSPTIPTISRGCTVKLTSWSAGSGCSSVW